MRLILIVFLCTLCTTFNQGLWSKSRTEDVTLLHTNGERDQVKSFDTRFEGSSYKFGFNLGMAGSRSHSLILLESFLQTSEGKHIFSLALRPRSPRNLYEMFDSEDYFDCKSSIVSKAMGKNHGLDLSSQFVSASNGPTTPYSTGTPPRDDEDA